MIAIVKRAAGLSPLDASGRVANLLHRLSALATAAGQRLTSPYRDVPPDSYRFPPF